MALLLLASRRNRDNLHTARRVTSAAIRAQADMVVAAVGRRNILTADMVKPGAMVIDVGMNRDDDRQAVRRRGLRGREGSGRRTSPRCRAAWGR